MTEISNTLMQEHQLILKTNQLMNKAAAATKNEDHPFPILEIAQPFVEFVQSFADRFHHAKEEEILFKYLNLDGVLQHCNPVPQMLHEHDLGRALVKRMQEAIYSQDKDEFIDAMKTYTNLLTDHIYKEDNILYPMAESSLTTSQKTEIQKEYHEAQARMNADEIWRKYKSFSSDLEAKLQGTCC